MRLALPILAGIHGLKFSKVLGCGAGNGFSVLPDFGTYVLLMVWENATLAQQAFKEQALLLDYQRLSTDHQILYMQGIGGHGTWDQQSPFEKVKAQDDTSKIAVITRATIYKRKLAQFWRYVPSVSKSMEGAPGLNFAIGIGELPLIQQATFSVWEKASFMMDYAYSMPKHKEVVKQTKLRGWYREELFYRFLISSSEGTIPELAI